jgi:UDP-2,3-diacylglucosamine hydrolase
METSGSISLDSAIFIADAHLNQEDIHSRTFLILAEKAAEEGVALFLLGDIFDLWFGAPGLTFRFQRQIIERLRALRRGGLRLYYVEGNRDFYLKKHHEGSTFDAVSEGEMRASVGPLRIHLSHGDTVNRADRAYRFWKTLSKNRVAYGAATALPGGLFLPLAERIERTLKNTNRNFRGSFPEKACREFALRMFATGVDLVVVGHFHAERLLRFPGGPAAGAVAAVPSWRDEWRHFHVAADGSFGFRAFRPDAPLV